MQLYHASPFPCPRKLPSHYMALNAVIARLGSFSLAIRKNAITEELQESAWRISLEAESSAGTFFIVIDHPRASGRREPRAFLGALSSEEGGKAGMVSQGAGGISWAV